jgi:hypothetical protein
MNGPRGTPGGDVRHGGEEIDAPRKPQEAHSSPVGNERYITQAEERVEGPIQAACALRFTTRERLAVTQSNHFPLLVLVLTTDELHLFTERYGARWRGRFRGVLDTEVLRMPLGAVERMERGRSILSATLRLTLTDGNQVTLRVSTGRSPEHGVDVLERVTDLIAAAARRGPAEDLVVVDLREPPLTRWRMVTVFVGLCLLLFLLEMVARAVVG